MLAIATMLATHLPDWPSLIVKTRSSQPVKRYRLASAGACRAIVAALCVPLAFASAAARAAPVTFNTALPVSQDHWVGRELVAYGEAARAGNEIHETQSMTALGYGVTPDLALFGVVPWIRRDLDMGAGGSREAEGLGNIQLFARYTVWRRDDPGGTLRIAPFLGLQIPTGEHRESDRLGRLPPALQPGSGAWDPFGGIVVSWATLDWTFDGQVSWQDNTKSDGIEAGDVFRADLALHRRILPERLTGKETGFLYGGVELNFRSEGKTRVNAVSDPNSGGSGFFVTPIVQYAARRWIAEAGVQFPVTQSPNGANFKQRFAVMAGLRLNL